MDWDTYSSFSHSGEDILLSYSGSATRASPIRCYDLKWATLYLAVYILTGLKLGIFYGFSGIRVRLRVSC
jgi:hypothetical protein